MRALRAGAASGAPAERRPARWQVAASWSDGKGGVVALTVRPAEGITIRDTTPTGAMSDSVNKLQVAQVAPRPPARRTRSGRQVQGGRDRARALNPLARGRGRALHRSVIPPRARARSDPRSPRSAGTPTRAASARAALPLNPERPGALPLDLDLWSQRERGPARMGRTRRVGACAAARCLTRRRGGQGAQDQGRERGGVLARNEGRQGSPHRPAPPPRRQPLPPARHGAPGVGRSLSGGGRGAGY